MAAFPAEFGWTAIANMKNAVSRLPGWATFLAASSCLNGIGKLPDSAQTGSFGHELGQAAGLRNGGAVVKEAFIADLVANMTVPELGKIYFLYQKRLLNLRKF